MEVSEDRLNSFVGKMLGDVGAAMNASPILLGNKFGLYKALARSGPMDPAALAKAGPWRHNAAARSRYLARCGAAVTCRRKLGLNPLI